MEIRDSSDGAGGSGGDSRQWCSTLDCRVDSGLLNRVRCRSGRTIHGLVMWASVIWPIRLHRLASLERQWGESDRDVRLVIGNCQRQC